MKGIEIIRMVLHGTQSESTFWGRAFVCYDKSLGIGGKTFNGIGGELGGRQKIYNGARGHLNVCSLTVMTNLMLNLL